MRATILGKSGKRLLLKTEKNTHGLKPAGLCSVEFAACSELAGAFLGLIREFLFLNSKRKDLILCLEDFSKDLPRDSFAWLVSSERRFAVHLPSSAADDVEQLLKTLIQYQYGEFSIFESSLTALELQTELSRGTKYDVLSLIANPDLRIERLIGLDIESDIAAISSVSEQEVFAFAASKMLQ